MSSANAVVISVNDLHKSFHHHPVLKGVDLQVEARELTVLIGPSGCGKSTFLRCLNGLEVMDKGRITIGGITLERQHKSQALSRDFHTRTRTLRTHVGMVFQSFNLFPHLTTLENVMRPPMVVKGLAEAAAKARALDLLGKVGLASHANHYPSQLSGGQQQRAAIARALAMEPQVMLYDEPTSALDPGLVEEVLSVMKQLDEEGMTQIVVTHEMRFARDVADKVVYFEDGNIVESGPPSRIFSSPSDERTRKFLRKYL
ncbi:MAG: amino acid ABC transporter ATP-binding protein [candidate division KSB1 bacterium]|nr:amino acid ABC transporter ATP-binding protein [candidate division KSB1 bacterium]MDZ7275079.1 amino acid ABC transporter ATP-binding protein [candidate division KSB1 bacterium]MDZ7286473.1 amino acid ABC transporter ATP-binding protein [candidate division KSB1 bacterium]MDZ7299363.1 amino acid ABC transporter ATP-binding protein [candidate division KSB1 bacterium]MDZ7306308.1 amino acid ABC transporter ATP-binding protein [candidate division KSB1 bacterium]